MYDIYIPHRSAPQGINLFLPPAVAMAGLHIYFQYIFIYTPWLGMHEGLGTSTPPTAYYSTPHNITHFITNLTPFIRGKHAGLGLIRAISHTHTWMVGRTGHIGKVAYFFCNIFFAFSSFLWYLAVPFFLPHEKYPPMQSTKLFRSSLL